MKNTGKNAISEKKNLGENEKLFLESGDLSLKSCEYIIYADISDSAFTRPNPGSGL